MPRKNLIRTSEHPYHLRARSNNKDWFDLPLEECFQVFERVMPEVCKRYDLQLHAFVLMSNHWHMIATTPKQNVDEAMMYFMSQTSRGLRKKTERINHIYGGRYRWSIIEDEDYYSTCFRYVAQNPLVAKITRHVEDYPYSTFSSRANPIQKLCVDNITGHSSQVPTGSAEKRKWLDKLLTEKLRARVRIGLRKPLFRIGVDEKTKKKVEPD